MDLGLEPGLLVEQVTSADNRVLLTLSNPDDRFGTQLVMWDLPSRSPVWSVAIEEGDNSTIGLDGRVYITSGTGIRVIDADGTELAVDDPAFFVAIPVAIHTLGSGEIAVLLANGSISIHDRDGGQLQFSEGTGRTLGSIRFSVDGSRMTTVDADGLVQLFDAAGTVTATVDSYQTGNVTDLALSSDGQLAIARSTGRVTVRTTASAESDTIELVHEEGNVDAVAFSPDGQEVVAGVAQRRGTISFDDTIAVWSTDEASRLASIGGESEDVVGCSYFDNVIEYSADGSFVLGGSHDYTITVLDGETYDILHTFPPHQGPVSAVALSPDNSRLVSASEDSTIRVWDLTTRELVAEHQTTIGGFRSLAYLPDGSSLVAADVSGSLSLFDPVSGQTLMQFEGSAARAAAPEISPDGRLVAAAGGQDDSILQLWSVASGQVVQELHAHSGLVTSAVFDPSGERLITGASDGTAAVWSVEAS